MAHWCKILSSNQPHSVLFVTLFINRTYLGTLLLALCLMPLSSLSLAEQRIEHLYEARIPLDSRDAASQQEAMSLGLASVMNKISGYSGTADFPELAGSLQSANGLVSEFGLQSMQVPAADQLSTETTDALYMRFVSSQVDQLIRQYEIPVWPANRADILFLVALELGGVPQLLTATTHPAVFAQIQRAAFDRGFSLNILNDDDLEVLSVPAEAVWNLDVTAIRASLATLPVDQIAVVRLQAGPSIASETNAVSGLLIKGEDIPFGDFSAIEASLAFQSDMKGQNFIEAFDQTLEDYLDQLSLKTAFVASGVADTRVTLEIQGVPDFDSFRSVRDYIQSLEQIENVKLLRLSMNSLMLQVEFQSGLELIHTSLINSGFLVSLDTGVSGLSDIEQLNYRYRSSAFLQ